MSNRLLGETMGGGRMGPAGPTAKNEEGYGKERN